ncbi:MAG TPA: glycosyltransferase [Gemmatimonadales bacterium]|nr:glycosyltransferase [Gemmatimonadales bacterium]
MHWIPDEPCLPPESLAGLLERGPSAVGYREQIQRLWLLSLRVWRSDRDWTMTRYRPPLSHSTLSPRPLLDDLTLVIPTLGRPILEESLQAVATGDAWPAEIILVDQGSSPDVAEWVRHLQGAGLKVQHLRSTQRGRARGVNRGIEQVRTRFFAVTDDDCLAEPDWLSAMVSRLRATPGTIITGRVEAEGEAEVVALMTSRTPVTYTRPRLKHDSMSGGNMGAAREVIHRVGPLDEDPALAAAEDCEYSYRALRSGVPITYAPEVVIRHVGWRDPAQRAAQYEVYGRSLAGFLGKYIRRGDAFIGLRLVIHTLRALRRWLRGLLTGDQEAVLYGRGHVKGLLPGLRDGWRSGSAP